MQKHLHIICLTVPYPVDYGGVFDLFYKLPALQQQGIKIHLHCFDYGRGKQPELAKYCEFIYYYPRKKLLLSLSLKYPHIVSSRNNEALLDRLLQDNYSILMEGVHCTYLLNDIRFKDRRCFVRLHNVEFIYYRHLSEFTNSIFKKAYFKWESKQLEKYEKSIATKAVFLAVTDKDCDFYRNFGCSNCIFLPLFLPLWKVDAVEGKGSFCLYQGDLSVPENEKAVRWLIQRVFNNINIPFVIAGKNPPGSLTRLIYNRKNVCLIANPDEAEMQDLIAKAHINIIPSYNATGIKLKLINALYNGRYCVVNEATVAGSGLEEACLIATSADSFKSAIENLYVRPFPPEQTEIRYGLLQKLFNNTQNAKQLIDIIWKEQ